MTLATQRLRRARQTAARGLRRAAPSVGVRGAMSPAGVRGAATELAWIFAHVALYPVGFFGDRAREEVSRHRLDNLSPVRRGLLISDLEAAGTPILLLHGMVGNRSIFTVLRRSLSRRGFGRVSTLNYSPFTSDVRSAARVLGRHVEALCAQTGSERVHVIAHSLGGVVARYYVQRLGGDARVHTLVTLGAPHGGTQVAHLLPLRLGQQLRPGSDLIAELAQPAPACWTRFVAIWSDLDQLIYPKRNARIDHPDLAASNVLLHGIGHMSLPIDRRVVREVVQALTPPATDAAADGVTTLDAARRSGRRRHDRRQKAAWEGAQLGRADTPSG